VAGSIYLKYLLNAPYKGKDKEPLALPVQLYALFKQRFLFTPLRNNTQQRRYLRNLPREIRQGMVEGRSVTSRRRLRFFLLHDNLSWLILQHGLGAEFEPLRPSSLFPVILEMAYELHLVPLYFLLTVSPNTVTYLRGHVEP